MHFTTMAKSKELSKKAQNLISYVQSELTRYESENVPTNERRLFEHRQNLGEEYDNAESALLGMSVTDAESAKAVRKAFVKLDQIDKQISICRVVKNLCANHSDDVLLKVFGAKKEQILGLLGKGSDWASRTYSTLKIGQITKTMLVFNLYRWTTENNTRRCSVTGIPTDKEIDAMAMNEGGEEGMTSDEWRAKHRCQIMVDIKSDTIEYTKYNKVTLAGLFYAEKKVTELDIYTAIQKEFAYRAFLEDRKLEQVSIDTIKKEKKAA